MIDRFSVYLVGLGIGRRLRWHCCQRMVALAAMACHETDLAISIAFYEVLGFVALQ